MIAVTASVACAAIALTAVVLMSRSPSGSATASASEVDPVAGSDRERENRREPEARPVSTPERPASVDLPADDAVPVTEQQTDLAASPEVSEAEPIVETPAFEAAPGDESVSTATARTLAAMSASELEDARSAWATDGRAQLAAAAGLRFEQLRLRAMFDSQVRDEAAAVR